MKKFTLFFLATLLTGATAMAESLYSGSYQLLDNKGKLLYSALVDIKEKINADGSITRTYIDHAGGNAQETLCQVKIAKAAGKAREVSESCPDSLTETECVGDSCVGLASYANFNDGKDNIVREKNTALQRNQIVVSPEPVNYLGLKNVKMAIQKVTLVKP